MRHSPRTVRLCSNKASVLECVIESIIRDTKNGGISKYRFLVLGRRSGARGIRSLLFLPSKRRKANCIPHRFLLSAGLRIRDCHEWVGAVPNNHDPKHLYDPHPCSILRCVDPSSVETRGKVKVAQMRKIPRKENWLMRVPICFPMLVQAFVLTKESHFLFGLWVTVGMFSALAFRGLYVARRQSNLQVYDAVVLTCITAISLG